MYDLFGFGSYVLFGYLIVLASSASYDAYEDDSNTDKEVFRVAVPKLTEFNDQSNADPLTQLTLPRPWIKGYQPPIVDSNVILTPMSSKEKTELADKWKHTTTTQSLSSSDQILLDDVENDENTLFQAESEVHSYDQRQHQQDAPLF